MRYGVRLTEHAQRDIESLLDYIVAHGGELVARGYLDRLQNFLRTFEQFPKRGTVRGDIRDGLRIIGFERSLSIAFVVDDEDRAVYVLRVLTRGQDFRPTEAE